jgi:N-acetylated-alpha-linked acidic dipeptidase
MGGSHTLQRLMSQVARDVPDPKRGVSVAERWRARAMAEGDAEARKRALDGEELRLSALGSGSDYTPFLQHLGVASLNLGFGGEGRYGQYHSIYDSTDHYVRFMDPDYAYGVALARVAGRTVLRLAQAELLPLEFTAFADTVSRYVEEIETLADELRQETDEHNRMLDIGAFALVAPPDETRVDPPRKDPVPHLNLAPLRNAGARLQAAAKRYDQVLQETGPSAPAEARRAANAILLKTERALTRDEGLPGRPWFKHFVYAPGFYTGYGVKTLPAVRETIEQREWDRIDERVAATAAVLEAFAAEVEKAAAVLTGAVVDQ